MDLHIFDRICADERYIPANGLWEELHNHQRMELLHHLQHGNLIAEGRAACSGMNPPRTEVICQFSEIPRHVWMDQASEGWTGYDHLFLDLGDPSITYVEVCILNGPFLKKWLGYGGENAGTFITTASLNVAGQKMNRDVWAAMAAIVSNSKGRVAIAEVSRILVDRIDLWKGPPMEPDHLRHYVSDFMKEFRNQH